MRTALAILTLALGAGAGLAQEPPADNPVPVPVPVPMPVPVPVPDPAPLPVLPAVPKPATVIRGLGNGVGNVIIVDGNSQTVITGKRWGVADRLIVVNPAANLVLKGELCYRGRDNPFWTRRHWDATLGEWLYWDNRTWLWFRYHAADDVYRPVLTVPLMPNLRDWLDLDDW